MSRADSEHDDWLLDESLKETFPASDPTSPARPGSLLGSRYASNLRARESFDASGPTLEPWLVGALLGGLIVGVILGHRRGRSGLGE